MAWFLRFLIRIYQRTLSPLLVMLFGPVCRFTPSCSAYAAECIHLHGAWRGTLLSVRRLSKCHPLHPGGYDPPPTRWPPETTPSIPPREDEALSDTTLATQGSTPPQPSRASTLDASPPPPGA